MKLAPPFELREPAVVSFVRRVVIKDDVDLLILRLVGQYVVKEAAKIPPLLILRKLRLNLTSAHFEAGGQIQRPLKLVSALQPTHYFAALGLTITPGPLACLASRLFL